MKNSEKIIPILTLFWLITQGILGFWWMYIIEKLGQQINNLHSFIAGQNAPVNLTRMIYWEGGFFFLLTLILTVTLMTLFWKDHRKNRAIHSFFASVGHEIKTPLASIKLQAEMINSLSQESDPLLEKYLHQIQDSTLDLEAQINNLLQLSRIELKAKSHLQEINLKAFIHHILKESHPNAKVNLEQETEESLDILADELSLKVIFKNLVENSDKHAPEQNINISLSSQDNYIKCHYTNKSLFQGDSKRLGKLFYKYNSPQGSGIGIYLINELMKKMRGKLKIETTPYLSFYLLFPKIEVQDE